MYEYKLNEDIFEDSVNESQSYSTFRGKRSASIISSKSPINQKGNSENLNDKLDMILKRLLKIKNLKENEQEIQKQ